MNAVQYIKNVGKSFGYIAVDTLKDYNPAITSTISQAKDLSSDLYQYVKDIKSSAGDRMSKSESSLLQVGKDTISDLWKNTKSDLMTGNFYNKARKDEAETIAMEAMMGFSMDDFNFDDDFGDFDFDDDMGSKSADPNDTGVSPEVETQVRTTEAVIRSMDSVGYAMSGSINRTSVKTAEYIVAAQERSSRALYDLSNRGFKQINVGLGAINANMTTLATLAQPLTTHMQNSATFYTNTSEFQKKTLELLGKLVENTSPIQTQSNRSRTKGTIGDLMSGGILDVRAYAEYVGGNVKDYFSLVTDMIGMMGGAKSTSKNLTASPISSAMKMALQGVMPKVLKESMKDFNEMLEGVFQTALGSMDSKNWGIFEILKEVLVPKSDYKSKLNTSKYHKGKVDWDGKSRKALLEVIPRYLAEISSAVTGKPMQIYDFDTGTYKTMSTIKKEWTDMYQGAANSAGSDLRSSANDILGNLVSKNKISEAKKNKMMSEVESYLLVALQSGDSEFLDIMKDNFNHIKYGLSDDSVKLIRSIFKYADSHKNRRFRSRTMGGIYEQRNSIGRRISDIEADGSSIFNVLFDENPEKKSSLLLGTDKDGHDIFFYLRGIYENTMGGGRGKGISRRSRNNKPSGGSGGGSAASSDIGSFSDIDDGTLDTLIEESFTGEKPFFPNRELEEYYYNKKANPNYPINDDLEKELEKWIKMNNAGKNIKDRANKNPVINKVLKTIGLAGDMLDKATVGISNMIDSASKTITDFVYGEKGTIGLFETIKGLFTDFRGTLNAMFGRGRDYFFGENGKLRPFMNSVGDNLRSAKDWLKNRFTGTAANGRRVTRSGMVSVSEGEMIIPAELNPYYHGSVNKRTQRRNELRNAAKFYGFFDEGGTVGEEGVGTTAEESVERTQEASVSFIVKILEKIFPNDTKGEAKKVQDTIQKALDTLKGKGGAMGAGALVGTGVSLFTGGMISPILGAGLGAAAGLIIKSKEVQTALFGDEEKDGMMGHHISEFVKKHLPSVATGSAVGLAGGLFLGSPVMGAILGGAAGYVNSSIQAKEFLFGSDELDSGIFSKEFQKRFKQNLPKMALGATAGLAFGPFGLAGNIILGAAAGYATDVEKSKKFLFGDPDDPNNKGGLFGHVKDDFFKPLLTIFDNLAESLRHTIRDTFHGVAKSISNGLANMLKKSKFANSLGGWLGRSASKLYEGTWGAIGGTMRGIANRGTKKALKKGYLVRDRKSKSGFADAETRIKMREDRGINTGMMAGFDTILNEMDTEDQYNEMLQGLQSMYNGTTGLNRQRSNYEKDAARSLEKSGADKKLAKQINKAMHDREYDKALELANKLPDTPAKEKVIENINAQKSYNDKIKKVDKARADLAEKIGVKPEDLKDSTLANLMDLTRNEAKAKTLKTNEQVKQDQVDDAALKVPNLLEKILVAIINPDSHKELAKDLKESGSTVANVIGEVSNSKEQSVETGTGVSKAIALLEDKSSSKEVDEIDSKTPREGDNKELNGEAYEFRNGKWENKEEHEIKTKFMRTLTEHFPLLTGAIEKVGGFFSGIKNSLFGDPENEEDNGLFGKIFDKFLGDESLIGKAIGIFTGVPGVKGLKQALSKITLGGIIRNIVGPGLLIGGFSGAFDGLGSKFGWGKENNTTTTATTKDGTVVTLDPKTGKYMTSDGTVVSSSDIDKSTVTTKRTDRMNVSESLLYNAGRGLLTNTKSITSTVLKNTAMGKGLSGAANKIGSAAKSVWNTADDGMEHAVAILSLSDEITEAVMKISKKLTKIPIINKIDWDALASKLVSTLGNKIASSSAKSLASMLSTAVVWARIVFAVYDYTSGYQDAKNTLGIIDEPTLGQKVTSGCIRLIKNCIPIVGTFIPDNILVDIFCEFIAPVMGMDIEEFKAQRSKAKDAVEEWNRTHQNQQIGSVTEYNKIHDKTVSQSKKILNQTPKTGTYISNTGTGIPTAAYRQNTTVTTQTNKYMPGNPLSSISGGSSGFISQLDPRYANMSIGNSTVGALGCGPASAVMALNQYSGNMSNAVNVAKGYQSAGGTDAAFFADYYARHGANASYYDGTSSAGKSNIVNSISSGSPVVLMGRDFRNRSKANSPFGPNNHYVVASGFDGAGNLIINDPESRGTRKYSSKILNNVSLGIGINGGRSGLFRRLGFSGGATTYSHQLRMDSTTKAIWKFFRDNGFSEEATAGIMGNMQAESGIDPTRLQVGGPAKGIVQWEGGRFTNMVNYAQSKGRDWTDLMSQLEFVLMEMKDSRVTFWKSNAKYCNNIEEFKKLKNVQQATHDFEEAFERAGVKALEKRYQYASYYYKAFSGKTPEAYDPSITAGVPYGTTQIPSSGSSSTGSVVGNAMKGLGILSTINSAFSKIGDIFNGSSDSTTDSNVVPFTSGDYNNYPDLPTTAGNGNAQSLIDVAASQLNVVEGKGNRTKYGQFTGTDGQAWCAAFVSWCMNEAFGGNTNKLNAALRGGKSASVSVLRDQFKKANAMSSTPQPGDIVLYKGHTGIVESVNGTKLTTIEGNTSGSSGSQDNGGMVARKSWDYTDKGNWRTQQLTGFGRPDWEGASAAGSGLVPMSSRRNQFKVIKHNQTGGSHVGSRRAAGASGISTDVAILLKSIIALIETLVKNTDRIDNIHEVLVAIAKSKGINDAATLAAINNVAKSNDNSSIEDSLSGLKAMVDNILAS